MIAELRAARDRIDQAIIALQRLSAGQGNRRGRPPAWMSKLKLMESGETPKRRGRPPGSKNKGKGEASQNPSEPPIS